ncbi:conserved protein of unknown function [Pararobbsia alpina]|uniref:hypothetical protein n=1 Tax=Pararobbsia alpina TaxID=621374 RepID=UPI0039A4B367
MNATPDIEALFKPLLGEAAWHVRHTHGSCVFIEFGTPHRQVREPLPTSEGLSPEQKLRRLKRKVSFRGDWSLLLFTCHWSLRAWDFAATDDSRPAEIALPFEALDGQFLKSVQYDEVDKAMSLFFDLGAELQMWPNADTDDDEAQWTLASIDKVYRSFVSSGALQVEQGRNAD